MAGKTNGGTTNFKITGVAVVPRLGTTADTNLKEITKANTVLAATTNALPITVCFNLKDNGGAACVNTATKANVTTFFTVVLTHTTYGAVGLGTAMAKQTNRHDYKWTGSCEGTTAVAQCRAMKSA